MKHYLLSFLFLFPALVWGQAKNDSAIVAGNPTMSNQLAGSQKKALDSVSDKVEIEASVSRLEWTNQLQQVLGPVIEKAASKGMKAGTYVVNVRFLVEKDGSISDVVALNDPGFGLANAAERAVKTGPHWIPGSINGMIVRSYHTQPITFVISEK